MLHTDDISLRERGRCVSGSTGSGTSHVRKYAVFLHKYRRFVMFFRASGAPTSAFRVLAELGRILDFDHVLWHGELLAFVQNVLL